MKARRVPPGLPVALLKIGITSKELFGIAATCFIISQLSQSHRRKKRRNYYALAILFFEKKNDGFDFYFKTAVWQLKFRCNESAAINGSFLVEGVITEA